MQIAKEHLVNLPQFEAQYARESQWAADKAKRMNKGEVLDRQGGEAGLRRSRAAFRAGTLPHVPYWSGQKRIGIELKPDASIEMLMTPKAKADSPMIEDPDAGLRRALDR